MSVIAGGGQERKIEEELKVRNNNSKGYEVAKEGDSIDLKYPSSTTRRGKVQHQQAHTLQAEGMPGVFLKDGKAYRVRRLTEKECLRLMGVKDDDSERIMKHQSRSSTYYMAGNSICTTCIVALIGEMIADVDWKTKIREIADDVAKEMRSNDCENV